MNSGIEEAKKEAAWRAAEQIPSNAVVGLGSGSTAEYAIHALGQRVKKGLSIQAVASSIRTAQVADENGIELADFDDFNSLDYVIDGADHVDPNFTMIKGRGGALVREKLLAVTARIVIIVLDWTKLVEIIRDVVVPLEVVPFGVQHTIRRLQGLGTDPKLREENGARFLSDNGNFIVDCRIEHLDNPKKWHAALIQTPGVVETGIFSDLVNTLIIGYGSQHVVSRQNHNKV